MGETVFQPVAEILLQIRCTWRDARSPMQFEIAVGPRNPAKWVCYIFPQITVNTASASLLDGCFDIPPTSRPYRGLDR